MTSTFEAPKNNSQEQWRATFEASLQAISTFENHFDSFALVDALTASIGKLWQRSPFRASIVSADLMPPVATCWPVTTAKLPFWFTWDDGRNDGEAAVARALALTATLGYGSEASASIAEVLAESLRASLRQQCSEQQYAQHEQDNFSTVTVAVCGYGVNEVTCSPVLGDGSKHRDWLMLRGQINLDSAVWLTA